jgi:hypothetical protein
MTNKLKTAFTLSGLILILAAVQAGAGLWRPQLYRDNDLVNAAWRGNDLVTLLVAVPLLAAALVLARHGSDRALLVWAGLLDYVLYNYAFYLFGAAFNSHFLLYAALFALALFALICLLAGLEVPRLARQFQAHTPARLIAGFMLLVALMLGGLWTALSLGFVFTGQVPGPVASAGHVTAVVFALDLTLVVPATTLAAVWLWQRRPWGYVLGAMLNVKGAVYMLVLSATTVSAMAAGIPGIGGELPLWAGVGIGSLAAGWGLLANMRPSAARERRGHPSLAVSER